MKVTFYSTHRFEKEYFSNFQSHELLFMSESLNLQTAAFAKGTEAVCIFVNDDASAPVLEKLHQHGVRYLALRSAGYNHVDLERAGQLGIKVANVPAYSPYAVGEHTVALMLALNRRLISSHNRVTELNFALDGLVGFDLHGKTAGIVGTGKIGMVVARILNGFGCRLLAYDKYEDEEFKTLGGTYTSFETLCRESDMITLHLPLMPETHYLINEQSLGWMKQGVMLINTSRGGLVHTKHVIDALKTGRVGYFGIDVYEEEGPLFFGDHSESVLQDDVLARLMTFRNVLITGHQAFLTREALHGIAATTLQNLNDWQSGKAAANELVAKS